jgi:hypothetical protein
MIFVHKRDVHELQIKKPSKEIRRQYGMATASIKLSHEDSAPCVHHPCTHDSVAPIR